MFCMLLLAIVVGVVGVEVARFEHQQELVRQEQSKAALQAIIDRESRPRLELEAREIREELGRMEAIFNFQKSRGQ